MLNRISADGLTASCYSVGPSDAIRRTAHHTIATPDDIGRRQALFWLPSSQEGQLCCRSVALLWACFERYKPPIPAFMQRSCTSALQGKENGHLIIFYFTQKIQGRCSAVANRHRLERSTHTLLCLLRAFCDDDASRLQVGRVVAAAFNFSPSCSLLP